MGKEVVLDTFYLGRGHMIGQAISGKYFIINIKERDKRYHHEE
jgi:hypothetical protein